MDEKIDLRKCPFCGGLPVFETKKVVIRYVPYTEVEHYQVKCTICLTKTNLPKASSVISSK